MADNIYRKLSIVGSSADSLEEAIRGAVREAHRSGTGEVDWLEVNGMRGHVEGGEVAHFQVDVEVGIKVTEG